MSTESIRRTGRFSDLMVLQRGFDLPTQDRLGGNIPIVASTGVVDTHCEWKVKAPGVVIGRSGSLGNAQYIVEDFWPLNTTLYVKDFKGNNPLYCYYFLKTIDFTWYNSGSGVPTLNRNHIHPLEIEIPNLETQDEIAQHLRRIDLLLFKNRIIVETSEEIISTLFRSWFIGFDPVKAKAEGRMPYGMDEETASLFPDSFEDSELGPIPTGWKVGIMEDVLSRKQDSTTPGEHLSTLQYVPIDNIDSKSLTLKNWLPYHNAVSSLILFSKNDLLFGAMRPYFHKVTVAPFDGITRSTCFVFAPKVPRTLGFSLCLLNLDSTIRYSTDSSLGSTMPYAIWRNGLARHKIVLPTPQIMVAFSDAIAPLIEKIRDGGLMQRNLSSIRDALLPKLMSGELSVS